MITVSKSDLHIKLQEYFRRVQDDGEELIVTENQVPVIKIVALPKARSVSDVFADVRGKAKYHADLLEPETSDWGDA